MYQPKTGQKCGCKRGIQRDNCPNCEGTGMVINFHAIRNRNPVNWYTVKVPFIDDMGSISPFTVAESTNYETKEEKALWQVNNMRDHDSLPHLDELPERTTFIPLK